MVDPITIGVAVALVPVAQDLLKRVGGPAADAVGEWLRDRVQAYRSRNVLLVAARAEQLLNAKGLQAHEVPLRTLLPLLESAANEDDPELQEKWAALLASAATQDQDAI